MGRVNKEVSAAVIAAAAKSLLDLPKKPPKEKLIPASAALLTKELRQSIKTARENGYTLEEILEQLKSVGFAVGLTTLKNATKPKPKAATSKSPAMEKPAVKKSSVTKPVVKPAVRAETLTKGAKAADLDEY